MTSSGDISEARYHPAGRPAVLPIRRQLPRPRRNAGGARRLGGPRRRCRPSGLSRSRRADETRIKAKGKWAHLCSAADSRGDAIDFRLSQARNAKAAKRLPGKALGALRKKQAGVFRLRPGIGGEARLVERAFGIGPDMMGELMSLHGAELERIAIQRGF